MPTTTDTRMPFGARERASEAARRTGGCCLSGLGGTDTLEKEREREKREENGERE
jgi:hypothetical protein